MGFTIGEMTLMDGETLKWLLSQGIGVSAAVAMFVIYRKDSHRWHEALQSLSNTLLRALQENTVIVTTLVNELREERHRDGRRRP